jgi:hypothetical protein
MKHAPSLLVLFLIILIGGCGGEPEKPADARPAPGVDAAAAPDKAKEAKDSKPEDIARPVAVQPVAPKWSGVVVRPTFGFAVTRNEKLKTGTGFTIVDKKRKPYMVTCAHLLPPEAWRALNKLEVQSLTGQTLGTCSLKPVYNGQKMSVKDKTGLVLDSREDIAIYPIRPGAKIRPLPLATQEPKGGDFVWFVGREWKRKEGDETLYAATVDLVDRGNFQIQKRDKLVMPGFSGSPIINVHGEVVGIVTAGVKVATMPDLICGSTVSTLKEHLRDNGVPID